ncbi:MAG: CHAP domain-containing protein [Patescibacteria group bacterium]
MAQATLINKTGQKVVVESGSQDAQKYFGQGYQLMSKSGKYEEPTTPDQLKQGVPGFVQNRPLTQTVQQQAQQFGNTKLANQDYVQGTFKALHGRPANANELQEFTNKGVLDVYKAIKAGIPKTTSLDVGKIGNTFSPDVIGKSESVPDLSQVPQPTAPKTAEAFKTAIDQNLTGLANQMGSLYNMMQSEAETKRREEELKLKDREGKFEATLDETPRSDYFEAKSEEFKIKEKFDALSEIYNKINTHKSALDYGLIQEAGKPISYRLIQGRSAEMKMQASAAISALSATASVIEGDINAAQNFIQMGVEMIDADRQDQIDGLKWLIGLSEDRIIRLDEKETEMAEAQIALLEDERQQQKEDLNFVRELIMSNPVEAQDAGITLLDGIDEAITKIQPVLADTVRQERLLAAEKTLGDEWVSIPEGRILNKKTGEVRSATGFQGDVTVTHPQVGQWSGQCGSFARSQYSYIANGEPMGDLYTQKQAWVNKHGTVGVDGLQVGDLMITSEDSKYGHALIVAEIKDGKMRCLESNYNLDEKVTDSRWLSLDSSKIYGYVRGTLKPGLLNVPAINEKEEMRNELATLAGSDGFVSPDDYTVARKAWIDAGLDPSEFDKEYAGFRNPNNPYYVTNKQKEGEVAGQFLSMDWFKQTYSQDQLKEAAKNAGYASIWKGSEKEIEAYLDATMKTIEAWRQAGKTDSEILEEMMKNK